MKASVILGLITGSIFGITSAPADYRLPPFPTPEEIQQFDRYHTRINQFHAEERPQPANSITQDRKPSQPLQGMATITAPRP